MEKASTVKKEGAMYNMRQRRDAYVQLKAHLHYVTKLCLKKLSGSLKRNLEEADVRT